MTLGMGSQVLQLCPISGSLSLSAYRMQMKWD